MELHLDVGKEMSEFVKEIGLSHDTANFGDPRIET
jgi:hypothetical protein